MAIDACVTHCKARRHWDFAPLSTCTAKSKGRRLASLTGRSSHCPMYLQASKFGGDSAEKPEAKLVVQAIFEAASPEEAARIGRRTERQRPELVVPSWSTLKLDVMRAAVSAKFRSHAGPRAMLLDTAARDLVEASPHDFFWGCGIDGRGQNRLGKILMELRDELLEEGRAGGEKASAGETNHTGFASGGR